MCRAEARMVARGEALIVHHDAEVIRSGIRDHLPLIALCEQKLPDKLSRWSVVKVD
jgi:hypothetical protein